MKNREYDENNCILKTVKNVLNIKKKIRDK